MSFNLAEIGAFFITRVLPFFGLCVWLLFGFWVSSLLAKLLHAGLVLKLEKDKARAIAKIFKILLMTLFTISLVRGMGVDITAVLGAAGVAGIAIGFAAQTSLANLISGLFLILERPFTIGDWIEVDGATGAVHSIEFLSTYIRSPDNRIIRIPNEMLAKSKLINLTRYPIRRIDLEISIACHENVDRVIKVLRKAIMDNPMCFNEPAPVVVLKNFSHNALEFMVGVWADRKELAATRTSILKDIKQCLDREGIELPYQRVAFKETDSSLQEAAPE